MKKSSISLSSEEDRYPPLLVARSGPHPALAVSTLPGEAGWLGPMGPVLDAGSNLERPAYFTDVLMMQGGSDL